MRILVKRESVVLDHMCLILNDIEYLVNTKEATYIRCSQFPCINNRTLSSHHCYNCRVYIILCDIPVTSFDVRAYVYTYKYVSGGSKRERERGEKCLACKYAPT